MDKSRGFTDHLVIVKIRNSMIKELVPIILSIITGFSVGFLFSFFKLPVPAPLTLAGVAGILGIYLGFKAGLLFFS